MKADLLSGIFKIIRKDGKTNGTGFVLSGKKIGVTCFHVVKDCLDNGNLLIQLTSDDSILKARLISSAAAHQKDIALIECEFPEDCYPFELLSSKEANTKEFKTYGFPSDLQESGLWGYGRIGDITSDGDLQLSYTNEIQEGFSGAPIIEKTSGLVAGICYTKRQAASDGRGNLVAFAKTSEDLSVYVDLPLKNHISSQLETIRRASLQSYSNATSKGGNFQYLKIEDALLTGIELTKDSVLFEPIVNSENQKLPLIKSLEKLWEEDCPHAVLTGSGGMGKTVSLVRLWQCFNKEGNPNTPIPIYIALNEFNNLSGKRRRKFILKIIKKRFGGAIKTLMKDPLYQDEKKIIPRFILLLDGYNELIADKKELVSEIFELKNQEDYKGIQMIFSSRFDMRATNQWQSFHLLTLENLSDTQIENYLNHPLPKDSQLLELLRNPMMLSIYTANSELSDTYKRNGILLKKIRSTGDMLYNVEKLQYIKIQNNTPELIERYLRLFILEHIIPYLAWKMQESDLFFVSRKKAKPTPGLSEIVTNGFLELISDDFYDAFEKFEGNLFKDDVDFSNRIFFKKVIDKICCDELNILKKTNKAYSFFHQNFRDYFAARHVQNKIIIAVHNNIRPLILQRYPLSFNIRKILGELEREHTNKIIWDKEGGKWAWSKGDFFIQNNLFNLIKTCKENSDNEDLGYIIWNLLTIWVEHRGELSGVDLSNINLKGFCFNNIRLSRPGLPAQFNQSVMSDYQFLPQGHLGRLTQISISNDNQKLISGSIDNLVKVWDLKTGQILITLKGHSEGITSLAFSSSGQYIVSSTIKEVRVWDAVTGECLYTTIFSIRIGCVTFDEEENHILYLSSDEEDGQIFIKNFHTGKAGISISPFFNYSRPSSFDGLYQLINSEINHDIKKIELSSNKCILNLAGHKDELINFSHCRDYKYIVTCSKDRTAIIWSFKTGDKILTLRGHKGPVLSAEFDSKGEYIVTGGSDRVAKVWSINDGRLILNLEGHDKGVWYAYFDHYLGEVIIVTVSLDSFVKVWNMDGKCLITFSAKNWINPDLDTFQLTGWKLDDNPHNHAIDLIDVKTRLSMFKTQLVLKGHTGGILSSAFNLDQTLIVTGSMDTSAKIWDRKTGTNLLTLKGHSSPIRQVLFSRDSKKVISMSDDLRIKVWDTKTGQSLKTITNFSAVIKKIVFSRDGRYFFTVLADNSIKVWDTQNYKCISTFTGHLKKINAIAISSNGQFMITLSNNNIIKIWDVPSERCLSSIDDQKEEFIDVEIDSNGKYVFTVSKDGLLRIWDTHTRGSKIISKKIKTVFRNKSISLDAEGQYLRFFSNGSFHIWGIENQDLILTIPFQHNLTAVAINTEGSLIAFGTYKGFNIWSKEKGIYNLAEKIFGDIVDIDINYASDKIITTSEYGDVSCWDAINGEQLLSITSEIDIKIKNAKFVADKDMIVTGASDGTIRFWDVKNGECMKTVVHTPGLIISGCNFHNLDSDSILSEETRLILSQYCEY